MEYTYYKLYKNTFRDSPPSERRDLFSKLYEEHEVKLIGVFKNREKPLEYYMMTAYQNENHYNSFINAVKKLPEYVEMTKRISEVRLTNEVVNLEPTSK